MDFSGGGGGGEPARWLEIAGKLLAARDLVGCKRLAERAVDADPLLPGADELLAVADVLLASQRLLPSGRPDPHAVLQLRPHPGDSADPADVKRSFRRLANLLSPSRNPHPGADSALRSVQDAFAHLSDHSTQRPADPPPAPPPAAAPAAAPGDGPAEAAADAFWTACPYCCHVYQYQRSLVGRTIRCPSIGCRRTFAATEMPAAPPIVQGTDMYYCAWGFFPMGFPKAADLSTNWKPFCPAYPWNSPSPQPASVSTDDVNRQNVQNNGGHVNTTPPLSNVQPTNYANPPPSNAQPRNYANPPPSNAQSANYGSGGSGTAAGPPRGRIKKTTARKKVGGAHKKHASGGVESGIEPSFLGPDLWNENLESGSTVGNTGININEVAQATDGGNMMHFGGDVDIGFDLDVDSTDALLGNLQHLPFLREDDNARRMF